MKIARSLVLALCVAAAAPAAHAANLLANSGFDNSLNGWIFDPSITTWSPEDAADSAQSGSARTTNDFAAPGSTVPALTQCVPVTAGAEYEIGLQAFFPGGQDRSGEVAMTVVWYSDPSCTNILDSAFLDSDDDVGAWFPLAEDAQAPSGAQSAAFIASVAKTAADGALLAHLDSAFFCRQGTPCLIGGGDGGGGDLPGDWFTDPEYPDFRFKVRITPPNDAPIAGTHETECQEDTVCVSGALPERPEVFIRILGPRPNGYLWPTIVRFTPSRVEVLIEQTSTDARKLYVLQAVPPGVDDLSGLQDRTGFLP